MTEKKFYGMNNDYMFKAVLQEDEEVLRNLVATLMGISERDINTCVITNPFELGNSIDSKDCVLDIKLNLNDNITINIELQLENEGYWPERSLLYWSRTYDSIKVGAKYSQLKPTYQIGILDFTLFKDNPEFYSEYRLLNTRTGREYTDKLNIRVLDLTHIDLAADGEEKLAHWAKIFKAKTMEELRQIAGSEEVMKRMVSTLAKLSEEEKIRQQCEAREKNEMDMRSCFEFGVEQGIEQGILSLVRDGIITAEVAAQKLGKSVELIAELTSNK